MIKHSIYFDKSIDTDSVNSLISELSQHESVDLYISSDGGNSDATFVLANYLNKREYDIDIHCIGAIESNAALLCLFYTKNKVWIHKEELDLIMFHKIDRRTYNFRNPIAKDLLEIDNRTNMKICSMLKPFLSKKQLKTFERGEDVIVFKKDYKKFSNYRITVI